MWTFPLARSAHQIWHISTRGRLGVGLYNRSMEHIGSRPVLAQGLRTDLAYVKYATERESVVMGLVGSDFERFRSVPLFRTLSDMSAPTLLKSALLKHVPARTLLFAEADRASSLYTLMEGAIELFSEHDDRRSTIAIIRSIRPFVLAAIGQQVYPLSARTLARSELLLIPLRTVRQLIDTDLAFARAIAYELANDFHDVVQGIKGQKLRTSIERLAEWMLRAEEDAGGTGRFVIPHDKCTLASYLGMEPESLSRNIASLAPNAMPSVAATPARRPVKVLSTAR